MPPKFQNWPLRPSYGQQNWLIDLNDNLMSTKNLHYDNGFYIYMIYGHRCMGGFVGVILAPFSCSPTSTKYIFTTKLMLQ